MRNGLPTTSNSCPKVGRERGADLTYALMSRSVPVIASEVRKTAKFARKRCFAESRLTMSASIALPGSVARSTLVVTPPVSNDSCGEISRLKPVVPRFARLWPAEPRFRAAAVMPDDAMEETACMGSACKVGREVTNSPPRQSQAILERTRPRDADFFTPKASCKRGHCRMAVPSCRPVGQVVKVATELTPGRSPRQGAKARPTESWRVRTVNCLSTGGIKWQHRRSSCLSDATLSVVGCGKWPGLTPEGLHAGLETDRRRLNRLGYQAEVCFVDLAAAAQANRPRGVRPSRSGRLARWAAQVTAAADRIL